MRTRHPRAVSARRLGQRVRMDKASLTIKAILMLYPNAAGACFRTWIFPIWKGVSVMETSKRFEILDREHRGKNRSQPPSRHPHRSEDYPLAQSPTSPEGITQQLAKALAHPLRVRILTSLHKGVSSPNQLAQELGEPLGNVSYHVKTLLDFDCVELVKTEPRRGAVEHFYRATERAFFSDADWKKIPASARKGISGAVFYMIGQDSTEALMAGTIDARSDSHVSRTPLVLDEKGWTELNALLGETLERAIQI